MWSYVEYLGAWYNQSSIQWVSIEVTKDLGYNLEPLNECILLKNQSFEIVTFVCSRPQCKFYNPMHEVQKNKIQQVLSLKQWLVANEAHNLPHRPKE